MDRWLFKTGADLYGLRDEQSDTDILVVCREGTSQCDSSRDQAGPHTEKAGSEDFRTVSPKFLVSETVAGKRWAWEAWCYPPEQDFSGSWPWFQERLISSRLFQQVAHQSYSKFKFRYMPEAQTEKLFLTGQADYSAWWDKSGWYHKVGYYLCLAAHFVTTWPDVRISEDSALKGKLMRLKRGEMNQAEWREVFFELDSKALYAEKPSEIDSNALIQWKMSTLDSWC